MQHNVEQGIFGINNVHDFLLDRSSKNFASSIFLTEIQSTFKLYFYKESLMVCVLTPSLRDHALGATVQNTTKTNGINTYFQNIQKKIKYLSPLTSVLFVPRVPVKGEVELLYWFYYKHYFDEFSFKCSLNHQQISIIYPSTAKLVSRLTLVLIWLRDL